MYAGHTEYNKTFKTLEYIDEGIRTNKRVKELVFGYFPYRTDKYLVIAASDLTIETSVASWTKPREPWDIKFKTNKMRIWD